MGRTSRTHKGGSELFENAALVGLGAYAAKNSDGTGWGIVSKVGTYAMYASIAGFLLIALVLIVVLVIVLKQPATPPTVTKEKMAQPTPHMAPHTLSGRAL